MSYALLNILRESGAYSNDELKLADDLLFSVNRTYNMSEVNIATRRLLMMISPKANINELMSSAKNLNSLHLIRDDAVRGIHAARAWMSKTASNVRRRIQPCNTTPAVEYDINGITCIENFMGKASADHLSKLIKKMPIVTAKNDLNMVLAYNDNITRNCLGMIRKVVFDCHALPFDHAEGNSQMTMNSFFQRVKNIPDDGDVQKIYHQDTYFDALKFWYFPDKVAIDDGPFHYVSRSHLLYRVRLDFIHQQSLAFYDGTIEADRTYGHAEGSLRIFEQELRAMDLSEKAITCKPDTLVIANVFGFHRRGDVKRECIRDAIHGSIRLEQPFH